MSAHPKIYTLPLATVIDMVAATLTKVTSTNDTHQEFLHGHMPSSASVSAALQARCANATTVSDAKSNSSSQSASEAANATATATATATANADPTTRKKPKHTPSSHLDSMTISVLAFHGRNIPNISIADYLHRINRYCPTSCDVILSLLIYFDRITSRINTPYIRRWMRRRRRRERQHKAVRAKRGRDGSNGYHTASFPLSEHNAYKDNGNGAPHMATPPPSSSSDRFGHRFGIKRPLHHVDHGDVTETGAGSRHHHHHQQQHRKGTGPPSPTPSENFARKAVNGDGDTVSAGAESNQNQSRSRSHRRRAAAAAAAAAAVPFAWMRSEDCLMRKIGEGDGGGGDVYDAYDDHDDDDDDDDNMDYEFPDDFDEDYDDDGDEEEEEDDDAIELSRCFVVDSYNVHRLIIAGITCASKFFSDVFYTNGRYAKVGGLPVSELNHLEIQFLLLNDFRLGIPLEEFERYGDMLVNIHFRDKGTAAATTATTRQS